MKAQLTRKLIELQREYAKKPLLSDRKTEIEKEIKEILIKLYNK